MVWRCPPEKRKPPLRGYLEDFIRLGELSQEWKPFSLFGQNLWATRGDEHCFLKHTGETLILGLVCPFIFP